MVLYRRHTIHSCTQMNTSFLGPCLGIGRTLYKAPRDAQLGCLGSEAGIFQDGDVNITPSLTHAFCVGLELHVAAAAL